VPERIRSSVIPAPDWNNQQLYPQARGTMSFVRVAVDVPLPTLFDYRFEGADRTLIGALALVPFGRGQKLGVILDVARRSSIDVAKIRPLSRVLAHTPVLPPDIIELLRFCSDYYHHPIGEVVHAALPPGLRKLRPQRKQGPQAIAITSAGQEANNSASLARTPALARLLGRLSSHGLLRYPDLSAAERRAVTRLLVRGFACDSLPPITPLNVSVETASPGPSLNADQAAAVAAILQSVNRFQPWLLQGVTGSGKTEVYLRVMDVALRAGGQVLLLVPEIGLTPQLQARIRARFPERRLVTLHSALGARERADSWLAAHAGSAEIVLGTRSAIFVPLPRLALIVVDEEHDTSFKQIEAIRYSARDLAVWRARQQAIPVILGSATPSLETYQSALERRYECLRLTERANALPHPRVTLVSTAGVKLAEGFAPPLLQAIGARIAANEQVLVYINRRGYAPVLFCTACGWAASCQRCSARLVLHKVRGRLLCHHCGHDEPVTEACVECGNIDLKAMGHGTQRIELALQSAFPHARLMRIDRDTTRSANVWPAMRRAIEMREVDILVGTQLLSKGHDFPGVGLVCVLNADRGLYSADFRASEQLFAQLVQVAGRAGRGAAPGEVLIQTAFPAHALYLAVQRLDFDAFARVLLDERKQAAFPPFAYQAVLRAEAARLTQALEFLHDAVKLSAPLAEAVSVFDPAPALMTRLKGRERAQLLVQSCARAPLHRFLNRWLDALRATKSSAARWAIDVDPLDV
jgi:primosomal protein N' (replication factor Y)